MRGKIAKHLLSIIYFAIGVTIKHEPGIIGISGCPRQWLGTPVTIQIKVNTLCRIGKSEATACGVNDYRSPVTALVIARFTVVAVNPAPGTGVATTVNLIIIFWTTAARICGVICIWIITIERMATGHISADVFYRITVNAFPIGIISVAGHLIEFKGIIPRCVLRQIIGYYPTVCVVLEKVRITIAGGIIPLRPAVLRILCMIARAEGRF